MERPFWAELPVAGFFESQIPCSSSAHFSCTDVPRIDSSNGFEWYGVTACYGFGSKLHRFGTYMQIQHGKRMQTHSWAACMQTMFRSVGMSLLIKNQF